MLKFCLSDFCLASVVLHAAKCCFHKQESPIVTSRRYHVLISGGFRGCKCTPLWRFVMHFCVHNCTSPSNDYAAVACGNNNQAQFTHVSVPYRRLTRPRVASRYSARTSSYFKQRTSLLQVGSDNNYVRYECINYRKWAWQSKNFRVRFVRPWLNPPF